MIKTQKCPGGGGTLGISGGGCAAGNLEPLTYTRATILDKINGKPRPPLPPKSGMGKWRVFALRAPSSLIWGDGGLLFHFVQDCLKASTDITHSVMIAIMTRNLRSNASKLNAFKANLVICQ